MILLYLICFLLGVCVSIVVIRKPIVIRFKVNSLDWCMPILVMFVMFSIAFILETALNDIVQMHVKSDEEIVRIICKLIDGGIIVPFISYILSWAFGRLVEKMDLDISEAYSEVLSKITFSVIILVHCFCFFLVIHNEYSIDDASVQSMINRIVIWSISVVGIWMSIGDNCEGRIQRYKNELKDSKKVFKGSEATSYYVIFGLFLFFVSAVYILSYMNIEESVFILEIIMNVIWYFAIGSMLILFGAIWFTKPSKKRSDKILKRLIKRYNHKEETVLGVKKRYENVSFCITKDNEQFKIKIFDRPVIYIGKEEEIENLFGEKSYSIEQIEYGLMRDVLEKVVKDRNEYIRIAFEECRNSKRKELEKCDC